MPEEEMTQEVTTAEETATADTSAETNEQETTHEETQDDSAEQSVPYGRFKQVNEEKKALARKIEDLERKFESMSQKDTPQSDPQKELVKNQLDQLLKEMGYVSQKELQQVEQDRQLKEEINSLKGKYSGKDGRPKFDPDQVIDFARERMIGDLEVAYQAMHQQQLTDWAVKRALSKSGSVKSETSDGSGSSQAGTTNSDLREAAKSGDKNALRTLIKRQL